MGKYGEICAWLLSLPTRERELKSKRGTTKGKQVIVAPYAGAWIEIPLLDDALTRKEPVAPYAGAWIEISYKSSCPVLD